MFIVPWDGQEGTACKLHLLIVWQWYSYQIHIEWFNSPCPLSPAHSLSCSLCFCVLELMPGAVPWMPRCLWWECSTSRKPHSCSQTQLISKGHHIRDWGFQLSQHNKVVTVYVRVCAFTVRSAHFHSWEKSEIRLVNFLRRIWTEDKKNKNLKVLSARYLIF